jgi:ribonuclease BN (tRNA processing enzyme)
VRFTALGTGTSVPDPLRGPAGFLVTHADGSWLVDGGSGTLQRCAAAGVDPRELTGGVYSHHHPDHCADLVPLLFAMRVGPPPRTRDYPVFAGKGFGRFLQGLQGVYGRWIQPGEGSVALQELSLDGPSTVPLNDGLRLHTRPARHSAGALHLRFETDDHSVVFSGDTGPSPALVELATDADLLVCECAGSDEEPIPGHLWPTAVAELVQAAQPRQVWLTHLYPHVDPAAAVATVASTGVPTRRADDGDAWEAGRLIPTRWSPAASS